MTLRGMVEGAAGRHAELGVTAVVAVTMLAGTYLSRGHPEDPLAYLLLIACALPLIWRRRHPATVLAGTAALSFLYDALDLPGAFFTIAIAGGLYVAADAGRRRVALAGLVAVVAGFLALGLLTGRGHVVDLTNAAWFAGWLTVSYVVGEVTRGRRAYLEEVERRAQEAERTREEEARRRAGEERIRIARELHDVLAHRISLISVQAGVGAHLLDRDPEQARAALAAISEASREALQELRATLGVLRQVDEPEPRQPTPGLGRLEDVVAGTRATGLDVQVDVRGDVRDLPTGVDLAAYRIIQEALTNVIRHARATRAQVAVTYGNDEIVVEVADDGVGTPPGARPGGGNGIAGMRERAAALGGSFEVGGAAGGGFRVVARLPLSGTA